MADLVLSRRQVLACRADGHGLAARRPPGAITEAVGLVGVRRTKTAALAVAARVEGVAGPHLAQALEQEQLVAVFGARGTVMVVPPEDVATFTVGTAPTDDQSLRAALPGAFRRHLDASGLPATAALEAVIDAVRKVLGGGPLLRGDTATAVTRALPPALTPRCRGRCPHPHVEDSLFRLAGVRGAMRFVAGTDRLMALDDAPDTGASRRELVRRYLRCYGPSTAGALAEWAGISVDDARRSLIGLGEEGVEVTVDGTGAAVLLRADLDRVSSASVRGVRFLPPLDPYLLDRDRSTLVPDPAARRTVWRATGNPGVVLVDAEPVATWRSGTRAGRVTLTVEPLAGAPVVDPAELKEEAQMVGGVLGARSSVDVVVR